jgi:hypothetical protein
MAGINFFFTLSLLRIPVGLGIGNLFFCVKLEHDNTPIIHSCSSLAFGLNHVLLTRQ